MIKFSTKTTFPIVRFTSEKGYVREVEIEPMEWSIEDGGKRVATIKQIPLRLAWAMTVHKSQGMSLDEAMMDISNVFEYGQGYVALSRVKTLNGLHLIGYNEMALKVHPEVLEKDSEFKEKSKEADYEFTKMRKTELYAMHDAYISKIAVKEPGEKEKKVKFRNFKSKVKAQAKDLDYDFEEVIY